ncbi:N-acetylmuramoyl-L-alanine amidase, partial [Salmonella enterica subsp. enterica serovar Enteritidis]|nr:N-acetylmuramoyl-L-alanine amidase [Salmonella enterica subsp. enterica serovar Enteritidis]
INRGDVAHNADRGPERKEAPGTRFTWGRRAAQVIGAWSGARRVAVYLAGRGPYTPVGTATVLALLSRYGYEVKADMTALEQQRVILAFQMHFRPAQWNGIADAEPHAIAGA